MVLDHFNGQSKTTEYKKIKTYPNKQTINTNTKLIFSLSSNKVWIESNIHQIVNGRKPWFSKESFKGGIPRDHSFLSHKTLTWKRGMKWDEIQNWKMGSWRQKKLAPSGFHFLRSGLNWWLKMKWSLSLFQLASQALVFRCQIRFSFFNDIKT